MRGPGKPHKSGLGAGLMRRVNGGERAASSGRGLIGQYSHLFTTDLGDGRAANMQSVLEVSDLDEMMAMADLAGRSFAAERGSASVVVSLCVGAAACAPGRALALPFKSADARGVARARTGAARLRRRRPQRGRQRAKPPPPPRLDG